MRKRTISESITPAAQEAHPWLDLQERAVVEVTSEHPEHPIEHAFESSGSGWIAGESGRQTIRLIFDEPQSIQHIRLEFREPAVERTQEFALRWSADVSATGWHEIVRQQWNFSPPGTASEIENYAVNLSNVLSLELTIVPNISGGSDRASLYAFRVA